MGAVCIIRISKDPTGCRREPFLRSRLATRWYLAMTSSLSLACLKLFLVRAAVQTAAFRRSDFEGSVLGCRSASVSQSMGGLRANDKNPKRESARPNLSKTRWLPWWRRSGKPAVEKPRDARGRSNPSGRVRPAPAPALAWRRILAACGISEVVAVQRNSSYH